MVVVCREYYDKEKEHKKYLSFDKNENLLVVELHNIDDDDKDTVVSKREYDLNNISEKYGERGLFLSCYSCNGGKDISDLLEVLSEVNFERYIHAYKLDNNQLVFGLWTYKASNLSNLTIISTTIPVKQDSNVLLAKKDAKASEMIISVDKNHEKHFKKIMAKRRLLSIVDANSSLSGLEPQVDILTKIVLKILVANPTLLEEVKAEIPLFDDFVAAYEEGNLLNLKTLESCIEEMRVQKTKIRTEQDRYFKSRG